MISYCNTNIHAEKIDTLNNMLNLENVYFQKYVLVIEKNSHLTNVTISFQTLYTLLNSSLAPRCCLSVTVLLTDLHSQEQQMFIRLFCCGKEGSFVFCFFLGHQCLN